MMNELLRTKSDVFNFLFEQKTTFLYKAQESEDLGCHEGATALRALAEQISVVTKKFSMEMDVSESGISVETWSYDKENEKNKEEQLKDSILDYLSEHLGDFELYSILHNDLNMSHEDIERLGFELSYCYDKDEPDIPYLEGMFSHKEVAHYSFTMLFGEREKALRALLESGKNFDTGWAYTTDEPIKMRIVGKEDKLTISINEQPKCEGWSALVHEIATEDDKAFLSDDYVAEFTNWLSSKYEYPLLYTSECVIPRDSSYRELMNNIDSLQREVNSKISVAISQFSSILHEDILSHIPDGPCDHIYNTKVFSYLDKQLSDFELMFLGSIVNDYVNGRIDIEIIRDEEGYIDFDKSFDLQIITNKYTEFDENNNLVSKEVNYSETKLNELARTALKWYEGYEDTGYLVGCIKSYTASKKVSLTDRISNAEARTVGEDIPKKSEKDMLIYMINTYVDERYGTGEGRSEEIENDILSATGMSWEYFDSIKNELDFIHFNKNLER